MKSLIIGRGLIGSFIHKKIQGSEITSSIKALDCLDAYTYDWVINCTFEPALSSSAFEVESSFDSLIIKAVKAKSISKYVMLSSRKVYPANLKWNAVEDSDIHIDNIESVYGRNKFLTELYVHQFLGKNRILVLRLPNIFGFSSNQHLSSNFFDQMLNSLLDNKVINFNFNRHTQRDFMYAADLAEVIQILLKKNYTGTYNCGYGHPVECTSLAEILIGMTGYGTIKDTDKTEDEFFLNTSKLKNRIFTPNFKYLKNGIIETFKKLD